MTNSNLIQTMKILRTLPTEFSKSAYDKARPLHSTRLEILRRNGFITKVREDEFEKEVHTTGVLFQDGTVLSRDEYYALFGVEWEQFLKDHGKVRNYRHNCGPKTITIKRYIYSANIEKLTAEVNERIAAMIEGIAALEAAL